MSWNRFSAAKIAACNKSLRIATVSPTPSTEKSGKRSEPAMERMQLRRLCVMVAARRVYCKEAFAEFSSKFNSHLYGKYIVPLRNNPTSDPAIATS
jgi:hypothetical protein